MHWPQVVMISVSATSLLLSARDHGKPKTGKDNFGVALTSVAITYWLLIEGGFFRR